MKKKLIIEDSSFLTKIAYLNEKNIERIEVIKKNSDIRKNQIYRGRVKKSIVSSNGKLIDLGNGKFGFLQENNDLKNGDFIIVQIKKEAISNKLAKLTQDINLSGEYTVYLPFQREIFLSNKIKDTDKGKQLSNQLSNSFPNKGFILRTDAVKSDYSQIVEEISTLIEDFESFQKKDNKDFIGLIYEKDPVLDFFHHFRFNKIDEIISNNNDIISKAKKWALSKNISPEYHYREIDLFGSHGISLSSLFLKKYEFGNISIVVEPTEAFTAIDINSGYQKKHFYMDDMALSVNIQSCSHIVDLIIKKDISGIILIDFIDMAKIEYKERLLHALKMEFNRDIKKVSVLNITSLGIVQVIRKREKENIMDMIATQCPLCKGTGSLKDPIILLDDLEIELKRYLYHKNLKSSVISVVAPSYLKNYLEENKASLESLFEIKIDVEYKEHMDGIELL